MAFHLNKAPALQSHIPDEMHPIGLPQRYALPKFPWRRQVDKNLAGSLHRPIHPDTPHRQPHKCPDTPQPFRPRREDNVVAIVITQRTK